MSDLQYVYAVARIRVKEKSLLTDADVSQMLSLGNAEDVMRFLQDRGWGSGDPKETADQMLGAEEEKTEALMRELNVDPVIFEVLSYPKLYHNLKAAIRESCTSDPPEHIYYPLPEYGADKMRGIIREKDFKALPEHMRKAAERALDVMLKNRDAQMCDVILDRACLDAGLAAGRKSGLPLLRDYEESSVAVTDIRIAMRAAKTGKGMKFLSEALAPCGQLDVNALAAAAVKDQAALAEYLKDHGFSDAADAWKESPSAFERWCDNRVIDAIRPQKTNTVSAGPVVAYYLGRGNEIKTVRIILTAMANGFPAESIRERVRKMYG